MNQFHRAGLAGLLLAISSVVGCGGSGTGGFSVFSKPIDLEASSIEFEFRDRSTRVMYVADAKHGIVAPVDLHNEALIDADLEDELRDTPIAAGESLSALAIDDRGSVPRVFVADDAAHRIMAFDLVLPGDPTQAHLTHTAVDLGGALTGVSSSPLFENRGRASNPTLSEITMDAAKVQKEYWRLDYQGPTLGYRVEGTVSGVQDNRAQEGETYVSDDGSLEFIIRGGGEPTTEEDRFFLGTLPAKPLSIVGRPVDLQVEGQFLYIVTNQPASVIVFDLDSLMVTSTIAITDTSLVEPALGRAVVVDDHLYVPNSTAPRIFDIDLNTLLVTELNTEVGSHAVGFENSSNTLYFTVAGSRSLGRWSLDSGLLSAIDLGNYGHFFASYAYNGTNYGLVSRSDGDLDMIDIAQAKRWDTNRDSEDNESRAINLEFFDQGAESSPDLFAISTEDFVTRDERWHLVFEGSLPGAADLSVTVAGDTVTLLSGDAQALGVAVGDVVTLDDGGTSEAAEVAEVVSDSEIRLGSAPTLQGALMASVRAEGSYVAMGTVSGVQAGRVVENETYVSNSGGISLNIRSQAFSETTRGDFFTFETIDGIDPLYTSSQGLAGPIIILTRPGDTVTTGYVVEPVLGWVSLLDLPGMRERGLLR